MEENLKKDEKSSNSSELIITKDASIINWINSLSSGSISDDKISELKQYKTSDNSSIREAATKLLAEIGNISPDDNKNDNSKKDKNKEIFKDLFKANSNKSLTAIAIPLNNLNKDIPPEKLFSFYNKSNSKIDVDITREQAMDMIKQTIDSIKEKNPEYVAELSEYFNYYQKDAENKEKNKEKISKLKSEIHDRSNLPEKNNAFNGQGPLRSYQNPSPKNPAFNGQGPLRYYQNKDRNR